MVMAESERGPETNTTLPSARLQWLRQRREALQEKLAIKNNELKSLCIDEAQLTGVIPPEIPLEPGESPPILRKRISTSSSSSSVVTCPPNIVNKSKTNQVEESALELERQVQNEIAKSSFAIVNDPGENKTIRRKHRQIYQQSQRRLKELETRLNFIRQGYSQLSRRASNPPDNWQSLSQTSINDDGSSLGKIATKHRIKKPRPPLEPATDKEPCSSGGSTTSSSKITTRNTMHHETDFSNSHDYYRNRMRYMKHPEHNQPIDHNDNPDSSVYPDNYRARTYSHGNIEDSSIRNLRNLQFEDRPYKNSPSMYNLEIETRGIPEKDNQQWQQRKYLDSAGSGYQHLHHPSNRQNQRLYYQDRLSPMQKSPSIGQSSQYGDVLDHMTLKNQMPSYCYNNNNNIIINNNNNNNNQLLSTRHQDQFHMHSSGMDNHFKENSTLRQDNEIIMHQQERIQPRRNTAIDSLAMTMPRHKITNFNDNWSSPGNSDEGTWYPDNNCQQEKFGSLDRRKNIFPHNSIKETTLSHPRYGVNLSPTTPPPPPLPPPPSLPSSPSPLPPPPPPHTRVLLRTQSLGSVEKWQSAANAQNNNNNNNNNNCHPVESPTGSIKDSYVHRGNGGQRDKEWYDNSIDCNYRIPPTTIPRTTTSGHVRYPRSSPSPSSISTSPKPPPASISPLPACSPNFNEINNISNKSEKDLEIPAESSNHAGKYQSYREVTKPFEMSDFYKYSTKYRKKQEQIIGSNARPGDNNQTNFNSNNNNANYTNNNVKIDDCVPIVQRPPISGGYIPPAQRRVYDRPTYPSS